MSRILLLDVYSLVYRAFFALPTMCTSRGQPTGGLYGFSALVLKLLREEQPKGAAVALDLPEATFRHLAFAGYKGGRATAPTPLGRQLGRLPELLDAFGFPVYAVPGFEADDVLATLAHELSRAGEDPLIVTGDLDALQCAIGRTRVQIVGRGTRSGRTATRTYDEAAVWERFGVSPAELPDWKALAGDVTDAIPGVPGIGGKRASALVRQYGGVDKVLARLDEVSPGSVREAIAAVADALPLWRDLARVRTDTPLPPGPRFVSFEMPQRQAVRALFEQMEFKSLLPRLNALSTPGHARP